MEFIIKEDYVNGKILSRFDGEADANVVIPDGVTEIGRSAFEDCTSLQSIVIPDSVTKIGFRAFKGCTSLQSVTLSKGLQVVDTQAFVGCVKLV